MTARPTPSPAAGVNNRHRRLPPVEAWLGRSSSPPVMSLAAPAALPLVADQSDAPGTWSAIGWTVILGMLILLAIKVVTRRRQVSAAKAVRRARLVAAPVAPPVEPVMPVLHVPPALRVHLCGGCGLWPVDRPGGRCYPYCVHPVRDAESITRDAARRGEAS